MLSTLVQINRDMVHGLQVTGSRTWRIALAMLGTWKQPAGHRVHAVSMDIDPSMPRPHLLTPYHLLFALIRSAIPHAHSRSGGARRV